MSSRPEYPIRLTINNRSLDRVVIDQHYREGHAESITDEIILELVKELDGEIFPIEVVIDGFEYFSAEPVFYQDKPYRIILLLCISETYLGVVNAFRVNRSKK